MGGGIALDGDVEVAVERKEEEEGEAAPAITRVSTRVPLGSSCRA
jgi:hypothetical protein